MKIDLTTLTTYAFWWTEVRLLVAAVALFLGGTPPIYWLLSQIGLRGIPLIYTGLTLSWLISGAAVLLLAWQWHKNGMKLFGKNEMLDKVAFGIAVVSGLNLGIVGLIGTNIGMLISHNSAVFVIVGVAYVFAAYHLYTRYRASGEKLF